jgi:hypothetical protein
MWRPAPLVLALLLAAPSAAAAQSPASLAVATPPQAVPLDYVFSGAAGILFFHVRPSMADQFEAVAIRVAELLAASENPVRRQQSENWKVFASTEEHENRIYVFLFDPVAEGADYDLVKILTEAVPDEVPSLYAQLQAAIVRIERMGLRRVR